MPELPLAPPLINGNYFDFSSILLSLNLGTKFTGFKSINYTSEQAPGDVYGASAQKLGRTRGQHKASGSIEFYRPEWRQFQIALQGLGALGGGSLSAVPGAFAGLFEVSFPIQVTYSERNPLGIVSALALPTQTDSIIGARITKVDQSHSQGSDALTVKCDFDGMYIAYNQAIPINTLLQAGGLI